MTTQLEAKEMAAQQLLRERQARERQQQQLEDDRTKSINPYWDMSTTELEDIVSEEDKEAFGTSPAKLALERRKRFGPQEDSTSQDTIAREEELQRKVDEGRGTVEELNELIARQELRNPPLDQLTRSQLQLRMQTAASNNDMRTYRRLRGKLADAVD